MLARRKPVQAQLYRAALALGNIEATEKGSYQLRQAGRSRQLRQAGRSRKVLPKTNTATSPLLRRLGL